MEFKNPFQGLTRNQRIAVIGGTALLSGYLVYRHHAKTGTWNPWNPGTPASGASAVTQVDPVTGLPVSMDNTTDPQTGIPYLQEAQEFGSVAAAEAAVSSYGATTSSGTGIPVTGVTGGGGVVTGTTGTGSPYASNEDWVQAVQAGLTTIGFDPGTVNTALQAFLSAGKLSPDQAKVVRTALAEFGNPPTGSFQVLLAPVPGTGKVMVTVPALDGETVEQASQFLTALGLKPSGPAGVKNEIHYVTGTSPGSGKQVPTGTTVKISYRTQREVTPLPKVP